MSKIEVTKMVFDTKTEQPELILADGSSRVVQLVATGNCWVEYWVTPEARAKSEAEAAKREQEWRDQAKQARLQDEAKQLNKPWWKKVLGL